MASKVGGAPRPVNGWYATTIEILQNPVWLGPLVLLTALFSLFEPAASSSRSVVRPGARLDNTGVYKPRADGIPLRIFTHLDVRLIREDLDAKLALHASD